MTGVQTCALPIYKVRKMLQANAIDITPVALDIDKEMGFEEPKLLEETPAEVPLTPKFEENPQKMTEEGKNEAR